LSLPKSFAFPGRRVFVAAATKNKSVHLSRKLTAVARLKVILKTITALFIRERLMAFAFLARDNYDLSRQLKITRVTNKFIDKERGSESFDANPSSLALLHTVVPLVYARALSK
jgi:hypothetical protein